MTLEQIVPVPYCIRRRAWEAAFVLATDWREYVTPRQLGTAALLLGAGPERLTWRGCGELLAMYRDIVGSRV